MTSTRKAEIALESLSSATESRGLQLSLEKATVNSTHSITILFVWFLRIAEELSVCLKSPVDDSPFLLSPHIPYELFC